MDKRTLLSIVLPIVVFVIVFVYKFNKFKADDSSVYLVRNDKSNLHYVNDAFKRLAVVFIIGLSTPAMYFVFFRNLKVSYQVYLLPLLAIASLIAMVYYSSKSR
jgi:predicted membrane protein